MMKTTEDAGGNDADTQRIIAVEEAYATDRWIDEMVRLDISGPEAMEIEFMKFAQGRPQVRNGLTNFDDRIRIMDETGVDVHLLSLTVPGVQMMPKDRAVSFARELNDELAETIRRYPGRFAGLGTVSPQAPEQAAAEIERAVSKLGLNGILINSHTNGEYLDQPHFAPLLAAAEQANCPVYIHPRLPGGQMFAAYNAYGAQGALWGFAAEAGLHVVRLILAGIFDKYPRLQIVLGHAGEGIPYWFYRMDNMYPKNFGGGAELMRMVKLEMPPSEYFKRNVSVTTSGMDDPDVLDFCLRKVGPERVMFAIDYPYESSEHATRFLRDANLSPEVRRLISHANAERIFGIGQADQASRATGERSLSQ
jgi:predicted TIM-barrel fold metal-dependent hydrolase